MDIGAGLACMTDQRAVERCAFAEAITHLTKGEGPASQEVEYNYQRGRELCDQVCANRKAPHPARWSCCWHAQVMALCLD